MKAQLQVNWAFFLGDKYILKRDQNSSLLLGGLGSVACVVTCPLVTIP
jgi:hypothetical protein